MMREGEEARRKLFRIRGDRPNVEADLDDELYFHYQELVDALIEGGQSPAEADAEATGRCRDILCHRRKLMRIGKRRRRKLVLRDAAAFLMSNLGWAVRGIRRRPGFSAVIIGTLALGIGANTLVFGVVDRLLLSPPPHIVDADQVRHLYLSAVDEAGVSITWRRFTYQDYLSLHQVSGFHQLAAYRDFRDSRLRPVGMGSEVRQAYVVSATHTFFPLLGIDPVVGRFFSAEDDRDGAINTAVLSEEYWTSRFGRDPSIIGRTISIGRDIGGNEVHEIIGVAPAGFTGVELERVDIWTPILPALGQRAQGWQNWMINIVVRVQEDVSTERVDSRATAVHRAVRAAWVEEAGADYYDPEARVFTGSIIAGRGPIPSAVSIVSKWLAALSIIVLIVACANVTNLLLVNNIRLRRELAIRASLGAGPARVAGQLLAQTVVLTALGGVAGLVLWSTLSPMLHAAFLPTAGFTTSDLLPRVLAFAGIAVFVTSLAAGLVPALQTRRLTDIGSLRAGSPGSITGSSRLRNTLVAIQTALAVVLLVGAGLFVVSLLRAREFDMGFSAEGVAEVELEFRTGVGRARRLEVFAETLNRIRSIPGIRSAATYAGSRPLEFGMGFNLHVPGRDSMPTMPGGWPSWLQGSADFLDVYGFRIVRGRAPDPTDVQPGAEPVMLVSRLTAQTLGPDGDVLNTCALVVDGNDRGPNGEVNPCRRIVGVFENVVARQLGEPPAFAFFIPVDMDAWYPWGLSLRAERLDARMLEQIRTEIQAVSSDIYFADAFPISQRVEKVLEQWTLGARLFTAFGLLGLVMACVGLYSILAFDVAERKRELGIRSALGAESTRLVNAVLRNSMVYVLGGLFAGTAFSVLAGRFLEDLLFQTTAADPRVYGVVVVTLALSGLAASLLPTLRAATADPMEVIRTD